MYRTRTKPRHVKDNETRSAIKKTPESKAGEASYNTTRHDTLRLLALKQISCGYAYHDVGFNIPTSCLAQDTFAMSLSKDHLTQLFLGCWKISVKLDP